jgi:hypothetical protein
MNLGDLALTCFAYGAMAYDDSLGQFERRVGGETDLSNHEHRLALLHWLNQWQCRQFSLAYHDLAAHGLLEWHEAFGRELPPKRDHLWEVPEATLEEYAGVFDALAKKVACYRDPGRGALAGRKSAVTFGPTAAAKILFVLRPKVFVAWDEPIRAGLRYDGSGRSYVDFLILLREELLDLQEQCRAFDVELTDIPEAVGRPLSTPAQLMDEFYWATVTRGVVTPSRQQLARWLDWYTPPDRGATAVVAQSTRGAVAAAPGRKPAPLTVPPPAED